MYVHVLAVKLVEKHKNRLSKDIRTVFPVSAQDKDRQDGQLAELMEGKGTKVIKVREIYFFS